jgi:hypothetical protein
MRKIIAISQNTTQNGYQFTGFRQLWRDLSDAIALARACRHLRVGGLYRGGR